MSTPPHRPLWTPADPSERTKRPLAQSPGSLVHRGPRRIDAAHLRLVEYDEAVSETKTLDSMPEEGLVSGGDRVRWLHFTGLHEVEELSRIGRVFGLSNLLLEDILHTGSRSKIENHESGVFVVTRLVQLDERESTLAIQHFSLLLLPGNVVLSFAEEPTGLFDPVLERIRTNAGGRIRRFGADYLAWALLDAVVDNYLLVTDRLDDAVVALDERLQDDPRDVEVAEIYALKRDINQLYRTTRPVREIAAGLLRENEALLSDRARPFFIDLNDHAIQVVETTEFLREGSNALRELYLSLASHRMNEVMKVLTCFSTIFLPLTFVAGIYGMNFEDMPELKHPWGYPVVWAVFVLCAAGMLWLFRRMRWL